MDNKISVLDNRVIDNKSCIMVDALKELLPLGKTLSIAVGYFYLGGYQLIKEAFNDIAMRGNIRIIMGKKTDRLTTDEISLGIENAQYINEMDLTPEEAINQELKFIQKETEKAYLAYNLRDLIAERKVTVKIYIGTADYFHAKAYLIGRENNKNDGYAIIGSSNFSCGGFIRNSELNILTMDSYSSIYTWFDDLWNSSDVKDFSSDLIQIIESNVPRPKGYKGILPVESNTNNDKDYTKTDKGAIFKEGIFTNINLPKGLVLRDYQKLAINNWFKANGKGTLKMATGSGKTITALSLSSALNQKIKIDAVIIICPYRHLVIQWKTECEKFGFKPLLCFESRDKWLDTLENMLYGLNNIGDPLVVITTNSTFVLDAFQGCLPHFPQKTLLIADEVHNLGSANFLNVLPKRIKLRIGLSATPERWFDDEGTKGLYDYFGTVLEPEFTLKDAISCGALVKYYYNPIFVELTNEEKEEYINISNQLKNYKHLLNSNEESTNNTVTMLLCRRARLLGTAKNKLVKLRELISNRLDTTHTIIYCGDGTVEEPESEVVAKHFQAVCKLLGSDLNFRVHSYTAETSLEERELLKERLDSGDLQGLVAIRCLDEGVDIPSVKTAIILASSSNPRQFIQRRGRVLRRHDGKKEAEIFDMIVLPPMDESMDFETERRLLLNEFRRYLEFAALAINAGEVKGKIANVQTKYYLHSL